MTRTLFVLTLIRRRSDSHFVIAPLKCGAWQYRELSLKDYVLIIYTLPDLLVNFSPLIETVIWWKENVSHVLPVHRRNLLARAMFHLYWKSMKSELDVELLTLNIRHTEEEIWDTRSQDTPNPLEVTSYEEPFSYDGFCFQLFSNVFVKNLATSSVVSLLPISRCSLPSLIVLYRINRLSWSNNSHGSLSRPVKGTHARLWEQWYLLMIYFD